MATRSIVFLLCFAFALPLHMDAAIAEKYQSPADCGQKRIYKFCVHPRRPCKMKDNQFRDIDACTACKKKQLKFCFCDDKEPAEVIDEFNDVQTELTLYRHRRTIGNLARYNELSEKLIQKLEELAKAYPDNPDLAKLSRHTINQYTGSPWRFDRNPKPSRIGRSGNFISNVITFSMFADLSVAFENVVSSHIVHKDKLVKEISALLDARDKQRGKLVEDIEEEHEIQMRLHDLEKLALSCTRYRDTTSFGSDGK